MHYYQLFEQERDQIFDAAIFNEKVSSPSAIVSSIDEIEIVLEVSPAANEII